tara:strand:- start:429 stop:1043 length:615 start_codon:yes stop_codon:yes gene_type:complete
MVKKLGIISGFGNYKSVSNLINYLKIDFIKIIKPDDMNACTHLIFPGVGSYIGVMENLKKRNLIESLKKNILIDKKYFLGICVGMQVLTSVGFEGQESDGLDIIKGKTVKIQSTEIKLPNIGWHDLEIVNKNSRLFNGIKNNSSFYFLHSYVVELENEKLVTSKINLETHFASSIEMNNIFGVQFHPEKSQQNGLRLIKNFIEL